MPDVCALVSLSSYVPERQAARFITPDQNGRRPVRQVPGTKGSKPPPTQRPSHRTTGFDPPCGIGRRQYVGAAVGSGPPDPPLREPSLPFPAPSCNLNPSLTRLPSVRDSPCTCSGPLPGAHAGDVNRDGYADLIVGSGPGTLTRVRVVSCKDGSSLGLFVPYPGSTAGVRVAAGDVTGDGRADVVVSSAAGGLPVQVHSGFGFTLVRTIPPAARAAGGIRGGRRRGRGRVRGCDYVPGGWDDRAGHPAK